MKKLSKTTEDKIFPENLEQGQWFERKFLDVHLPSGPLWVAKTDGLPKGTKIPVGTRLVWASGWKTWKKLSELGVWVSGCNESLGEAEDNNLKPLFGQVEWTKITHKGAQKETTTPSMKTLSTYEIIPLETTPDIKGKTHFYWMSGSSFLLALKNHPWIKEAHHSCGPGNTYETISQVVSATVFPGYEHWKKEVLK